MPFGGILTVGSAALSAAKGGFQLGNSLHKLRHDKEELAKLKTPFYKIQDEYYQNRNLANEQAQGGLPSATKDYYTNESQRGLGAGIGAIEATGGNPNDISHLFDIYDKSIDRVASADAEAHLKNIDYFMNVNKDLAGQKTTQWGINEYKPYQDKLSEITNRRAADEKSAYNGVSGIIGGIGAAGTGMQNSELLKSLLSKTKGAGTPGLMAQVSAGLGEPFSTSNGSDTTTDTSSDQVGNSQQLFQQFQQWLAQQNNIGKT